LFITRISRSVGLNADDWLETSNGKSVIKMTVTSYLMLKANRKIWSLFDILFVLFRSENALSENDLSLIEEFFFYFLP